MAAKRILRGLLEAFSDDDVVSDSRFDTYLSTVSSLPLDASGLRLAFDCLRGDERASRELRRLLESEATKVSSDLLSDSDLRAELCQQTHVMLLYGGTRRQRGHLLSYEGRSPLPTWLRVALMRQCIKQKRRHEKDASIGAALDVLIADRTLANPELDLLKRNYAGEFRVAFRQS
ncbi:MAG: hypothetical protein AAFV29_18730, partial [Myxococcota bacterium]